MSTTYTRPAHMRGRDANGKRWNRQMIIEALHKWEREYGRRPFLADFDTSQMQQHREPEYVERMRRQLADGVYPRVPTIKARFGSWNKAVVAAGWEAMPRGSRTAYAIAEAAKDSPARPVRPNGRQNDTVYVQVSNGRVNADEIASLFSPAMERILVAEERNEQLLRENAELVETLNRIRSAVAA